MRKIYIALLSLLSFFLFHSQLQAQAVGTYVFQPSSGTFTPLDATATTSTATGDDGIQAGIPLGFNFTYSGTVYTFAAVTTNGFLRLGTSNAITINTGTPNYDNTNFGTSTNVPLIAGIWDDNNASGGSLLYNTTGTAPNRVFTAEWRNIHVGGNGSGSNPTGSFQISLYESTNFVKIVYGTINALSSTSASIGLNDATSFLSVTPGAPATASNSAANNTISSATNLTSGTTYTFFPPPPCVPGSLAGGTAQGPSGTLCSGSLFTVSVSGASFGVGLTYQWESSTDNTNWAPVIGATGQGLTTAAMTSSYYRRKMTCSGIDAYSTSYQVITTAPLTLAVNEGFNTSGNTVFPTCWSQQYVVGTSNITFETGSTNPVTTPLEGTRYVYWNAFGFTNNNETRLVSPAIVTTGTSSVDVQFYWYNENNASYSTGQYLQEGVQVQYSLDGTTWVNAGSLVTRHDASLAAGTGRWKLKKVTLPAAAGNQPGLLIAFKFHSGFGDNCSLDAVSVVATSNCVEPSNFTVTSITSTTATLNWTASPTNPSNGYQWEVRISGAPGSGATGLVASGTTPAGITTANVTGLAGSTVYNYYVRSDCGTEFSIWPLGSNFTSACGILPLPITQGFNTAGTSVFPVCWSQQIVTGTGNITFQTNSGNPTTVPFEGTRFVNWNSFNIGNNSETRLVSPAIATTGVPGVNVEFYWYNEFNTTYSTGQYLLEGVQVQYSLDGITWVNAGSLITRNDASLAPGTGQWKLKKVSLPAAAGNQPMIYVGFKFHSGFGDNCSLDAVNIIPTPPCVEPTNLTVSNLGPTSITLNWTASPSNPSNGYQWEIRTSGDPGSGPTGLAVSGTTTAGVTTANAAGLIPNTAYSYYVLSDCGGGTTSVWSARFGFATPCNPISIPFSEGFTNYATTFPPNCWSINNTTYMSGQSPGAYGIGLGSAEFNFFSASAGTNLDLTSPLFAPTPAGWGLVFDHAYATFFAENDQLQILYSTNGGGTYTNLITYNGGGGGPLNTAGAVLGDFSPTASQWANKAIVLPTGTNRLLFRGVSDFGNNLFLDNIAIVSCLPVTNVQASGISPSMIKVSFTGTAGPYYVEWGPPGFIPGTGATAGAGTVAQASGSPYFISTGLSANTNYDVYVRRECTAGVSYSINSKTTTTTLCSPVNIPYLQTFESAAIPGLPTCTSLQDVNGNSGSFTLGTGGGGWETYADGNPLTTVSPSNALVYSYDPNDNTRPADDWFYTQGLNLTAGTSYRLKFFYKAADGLNFPEKLEVKYGTLADASTMTNSLFINNNINSVYANPFDSVRVDFIPSSSGVYYFGFHAISDPDEFVMLLDDISVKTTPLVDVGISAITLPNLTCPASGVFIQATIKNYNLATQDFATYPVTVTGTITGAGSGTVSTTLNTGTLAPGASMNIYLSPAFNFPAGDYTIRVKTVSAQDPETVNDSTVVSITVNANPPAPVITPASPAMCIGRPIQLSTQFTASPPPVALPAVTSGTISVAIPDATVTGASHTLTVNSVPAGATVTDIAVTLNVTHTWVGDLIINVKAPNGQVLNLFNREGNAGGQINLTNTVISSAATNHLPATGAPFTGTYLPDGAIGIGPTAYLSTAPSFDLLKSKGNGSWTIAMNDNAFLDAGTLTSWSITLTYQIVTPTITWTPLSGLYTNAGATSAYTGGNAISVYANPPATASYTVTATTSAGCSASASTTVTVSPFPVVTTGSIPDTVCTSDQLIPLVASPSGGSWSGPGVSGTNFIPPSTSVGTYTLTYTYTSPAGCASTATKKISVKECPERMILLRDNALLLYPNPNTGQFNVRVNSVLYNNLVMKVYSNNGTLVSAQQLGGLVWGRVIPIDLTNLPGGVYMVKFYYDGGVRTSEKTFKVIVGHR